mgnify:CR=1 FL=1
MELTNLSTLSKRIIVTCSKRLSPYLEKEIIELGFTPVRTFQTGVELLGTMNDCIRLNLNLRCASQVLYSLRDFFCNGPDDVYRELLKIPWEQILSNNSYFSVTSNVNHPSINNSLYANVKVKDAIADRMRAKTGGRPNSGSSLQGAVIHLFWKDETAEVFIDTSGDTLAKHGYRKIPGKAPMLESLAAATIMATKWNRQSTFINPMCGSATIAIEATLLATNRRPGLFRENYAFMHLKNFDDVFFGEERRALDNKIIDMPDLKIIATDISADAINISKINAGAAGIEKYIKFIRCSFEETPVDESTSGIVFLNPEYGERMGDENELEETYAAIGDFMKKKCKGYTGYVFTGNLSLAKKIGLKPKRKIEFYTSKIDCRLLEYELYAGTRRQAASIQ